MEAYQIKDVLMELGYELQDRGEYWQTTANYRDGDNKTALQIYKNTGVWKDHVQQSKFSPFKALVEKTLGTTDSRLIEKYLNQENTQNLKIKMPEDRGQKISMEETHDESILNKLLPHYSFYNVKGISDSTLKAFKGGLATKGQMYHRFVFPIYNENSMIHGFAGRDVRSGSDDNRPKWKHMGRKTNWVYPYYVYEDCASSIDAQNEVILVESIGDALNLYENGVKNVLVSFGLDVSNKLMCFLVSLSVKRIVLSFNNDSNKDINRGLQACVKNYLKLLNFFDPNSLCICLPTENDFGEMKEDSINSWKNKLLKLDAVNQIPHIIKEANKMHKSGAIRKSLYKKLNQIK